MFCEKEFLSEENTLKVIAPRTLAAREERTHHVQAADALEPLSLCRACTLRPPCQHISEQVCWGWFRPFAQRSDQLRSWSDSRPGSYICFDLHKFPSFADIYICQSQTRCEPHPKERSRFSVVEIAMESTHSRSTIPHKCSWTYCWYRSWLVEGFAGETSCLREWQWPQDPQEGGGEGKEMRGRGLWIVRILCGEALVGFSMSGGTAAITTR